MNKIKEAEQKYKNLSKATKAAIWFTISNFLVKGISFITVPLFAGYLSPEEYGKYSIYQTYQGILINFATFEMYSGAYVRGILRYKENIDFFTWSEQLLSSIITILSYVAIIPLSNWLVNQTETNNAIIILTYLYFLVLPAFECWINRKRFDYEYKPVIVSTIIYTLLSTFLPFAAILKISRTSNVRIFFMLISEVAFCIPFYFRNIHLIKILKKWSFVKEQWRYLLLFQLPSVVHAFSYIILSSMDRIMIGSMVGKKEAGIYSIATTLANVIAIFSISANQVLKPWRYQKMEKKDYSAIRNNSSSLLLAFGTFIIIWVLIAPEFLRLLFSDKYFEARWAIPPISMSVFFIFLYSMYVDIEEFFYKTKYSMYATTICAVLNVALNYYGIQIWGYVACAYTTLVCYVLLAVLHCYWASKACIMNNISISHIFDIKHIFVLSIGLLAMEILVTVLYGFIIVRYFVVGLLSFFILMNFKRIYRQFKTIEKS